MEEKTFKILIPDGYEVDCENCNSKQIVFKKKNETPWRKREAPQSSEEFYGYYINPNSTIEFYSSNHSKVNRNLFATEKQAKSALAMAQISQIMEHDPRFGGAITDEEWNDGKIYKYAIQRVGNTFISGVVPKLYCFLAFHKVEQCNLFIKENLDLIKDYLMIE